mgnify:CR=1 FL=1
MNNQAERMIAIRTGTESDAVAVLILLKKLAKALNKENEFTTSLEDLTKLFSNSLLKIKTVIAEYDGSAIGVCLYFFTYSSWRAEMGIYIQDLFVDKSYRGQGIATKMLRHALRDNEKFEIQHLRLSANRSNKVALNYYMHLGVVPIFDEVICSADAAVLCRIKES